VQAVVAVFVTPSANAVEAGRANSDVRFSQAWSAGYWDAGDGQGYLPDRGVRAGYVAEVQTFTYPKFEDLGSNLSVGKTTIEGIEWLAGWSAHRAARRST